MEDKSASQQIDDIIQTYGGWKGEILSQIRAVITQADSDVVEEIKWKMATRPEGLPVWAYNGIVCFAETWKDNIKLIFFKGAQMTRPKKLFNARLNSAEIRAIEFHDCHIVDQAALKEMLLEAVQINKSKTSKS